MAGEISLGRKTEDTAPEEEQGFLRTLEGKVENLLSHYQELMQERNALAAALDSQTEKVRQLEKRLDLLTQDREKVKIRIDHLLHRLKGMDF